ncbi:NTP transferase domain-containing protein [Devosia algicola]|uniref:NTP transferase domain-containing protein n=1 Tax=Devosia algicola TaxID=3026418 RepID=A0ABY7YPX4_9HYPH|nr:NTP transferase domain-containing protein [Devosia algicola]WDR03247.1 NTP transferase domain-containing protein [Devosia algicola]
MKNVVGLIYAGGQGQRLGGVCKANLKIGGAKLLDRAMSALGMDDLLVSVGPGPETAIDPRFAVAVPDLNDRHGGPLAGLVAGVDYLLRRSHPPEFVLTTAVDTPFLPGDYFARLHSDLNNRAAVFAGWGDHYYPTNALWRLAAIADLPERTRNETAPKSLKHLLREPASHRGELDQR